MTAPPESVRVALRALCANPVRSALTMLGIVVGVAAVITMVAVGAGAHARVAEQIRSLGANLLLVQPGTAVEGGVRLASGTRHTLTEADAETIRREVPGVEVAVPVVTGGAQVVQGALNWNTRVGGTEPEYFIAREWPFAAGRAFTAAEVASAAKVAVLGATVAEALFGADDPVDRLVRIGAAPFIVVGVLASKGESAAGRDQDDGVFVPISTAKLRVLGAGAHRVSRAAVDYVLVKVADAAGVAPAGEAIRRLLRQRHRLPADAPDDFRVSDPAAAMDVHQEATRTLTLLLAAVASVSLVVGGISIMNTMLASVTERTREIGLRLAVGARPRDVLNQFLVEAVTLCLLGGGAGLLLGAGAAVAVAELAGWPIFIGPGAAALALGFAGAVGIFFGLYPALQASRLNPIEALRRE